jgi:5-methylcytosine-specific restriction endonuclease McrA
VAKKTKERIDGLSSENLKRVHIAVRKVWQWSHSWRLAKKRALHADGFYRCENPKCEQAGQPAPKVVVDHIKPVGQVGGPDYIKKMFVPSSELMCLCNKCHRLKTNEERKREKNVLEKEEGEAGIDFSGIHLP